MFPLPVDGVISLPIRYLKDVLSQNYPIPVCSVPPELFLPECLLHPGLPVVHWSGGDPSTDLAYTLGCI
eukprot:2128920-Ditylum_brightwellii.AAC.1